METLRLAQAMTTSVLPVNSSAPATITSTRQGAAVVADCEVERKARGLGRVGIEGLNNSSWIVLDYGDIVVHLLLPEQREFYALEHLWADGNRIEA